MTSMPARARRVGQRAGGCSPHIGDGRDRHAGGVQIERRLVGAVGGGDDDRPLAHAHAIAIEIRLARRPASMMPGRSLPGNTSGRSMAPVASTTARARTCHSRSRGWPAGGLRQMIGQAFD